MVSDGFADVASRTDAGFKAVEERLFDLEGDTTQIKTKLTRLEEKLTTGNYETRLTSLEEDVGKLKTRAGIQ
jgi:predicted  nucleic acid-binding Zn-ribbon protein